MNGDVKTDRFPIGPMAIATTPLLVSIVLYYSLAIHMHAALGGWPSSIGTRGFPPSLATHANITEDWITLFGLSSITVCPFAALICGLVKRWRPYLIWFLWCGGTFLFFVWSMYFAPKPYLTWWLD